MAEGPIHGDLRKPCATARKKARRTTRTDAKTKEANNKRAAKRRDSFRCRFPLCGCDKLKLALEARLESSHDRHKGMGGNPSGDRSTTAGLITLCKHRHQDGIISRHKGTLRAIYLTDKGSDGPVAWEIDLDMLLPEFVEKRIEAEMPQWFEVARETAIRRWLPFTEKQDYVLKLLAEMER